MEGGYSINHLPGRINWIFSLHFSVSDFKNMQLQLQLLCTKLRRFSRAALMLKYVVEISVSARQLEAAVCFFRKLQILFFSSVEQYLFCFVFLSISRRVEKKECVQGGWKKWVFCARRVARLRPAADGCLV